MRGPRPLLVASAAGVVVGLLATVALVVGGAVGDEGGDGPRLTGDAAQEALEAAWVRHRTSDHVVEAEWRRTMRSTGGTLTSATLSVNRPPDRLVRQFGALRGVVNGVELRCNTSPDGEYRCFPSERPAPDLDEVVADELAAWRSYTAGPRPLYELTGDGEGCFDLRQVTPYPDPPYGQAARLCFDADTGALRFLRRELPTAVEEQEALSIRAEVTAADLDTAADDEYAAGFEGGGAPGGAGPLPGELDPATTTTSAADGG